jgi:hypothetical protein
MHCLSEKQTGWPEDHANTVSKRGILLMSLSEHAKDAQMPSKQKPA